MNKEKLEELQGNVIAALEFALGNIGVYNVDDSDFYDAVIECINNVEEAKEHLENIQNKLGEETKEGQ